MPSANATAPLPSTGMSGDIIQVLGVLLLLVAVLYLAYYLLRRFGGKVGFRLPEKAGLVLVAQLPLGPKRGVAVVRFKDTLLVLGVTDHSINLLEKINDGGQGNEKDFSKVLEKQAGSLGTS